MSLYGRSLMGWDVIDLFNVYEIKNSTKQLNIQGIVLSIILVHLAFSRLAIYLNSKFENKNTLLKIKTFLEYLILIVIGYFIFF